MGITRTSKWIREDENEEEEEEEARIGQRKKTQLSCKAMS